MNKEKLQQDIDAMREKLALMEAKLQEQKQEKDKKYFIPEIGEAYWFVAGYGDAYFEINDGDSRHSHNIATGNCYKTPAEVEKADAKQKAYIRIVRALRDHEKEGEYCDSFIYDSNEFVYPHGYYVSSHNYMKFSCLNLKLLSTRDACQWVIDNMQDDLNLYFGE